MEPVSKLIPENYPLQVATHEKNKEYEFVKIQETTLPYFLQKQIDEDYIKAMKEAKKQKKMTTNSAKGYDEVITQCLIKTTRPISLPELFWAFAFLTLQN